MARVPLGWLSDFGWERGRLVMRETGVRLAVDRHVLAELGHWLIYLVVLGCAWGLGRLRRRRPLAILFAPQRARPWYLARGAALWTGVRSARREADADIAFYFEDATVGAPSPSRLPVLNGGCVNISKSHAAAVFERVFGRRLRLDPRVAQGDIVEKSERNGVHDGRVITGPCLPRPGRVYQRCIDSADGAGVCRDLRTVCVGGRPVVVWEKEKPAGSRFSINNRRATLREPADVFSAVEREAIGRFCDAMGLDWGGLDILRDRGDGQIYIVDVNKTDLGPVVALSWPDKIRSMARLGAALRGLIAARLAAAAETFPRRETETA